MTANSARLTDELLRRSLVEMAAGPDAGRLLGDVLRTVDATAQVARRPWETPGWRRAGLLVAATLLLIAAIGTAIALSSPRPQPQPTPSAPALLLDVIRVPDFRQPFTYRLPPGETARLTPRGSPDSIYALGDDARSLQVFAIWSSEPTEPMRFLQGLRDDVGDCIGPISPAVMGNLSALSVVIDPTGGCADLSFHEPGVGQPDVLVSGPSLLLAAQTSHGPVGVLISASDADAYAAWLPVGQAYVDSFEISSGAGPVTFVASDFVQPFSYSVPPGGKGVLAAMGVTRPAELYGRDGSTRSRRLRIFLVSSDVHACPEDLANAGSVQIGTQPSAFLEGLRDTVGVGIGPISPTTLGNLPALAARVDPTRSRCSPIMLHENGLGIGSTGLEPRLDDPGQLIVAEVGAQTVGVLISSFSEDDLAEWLPVAQAYVDTFVFDTAGG